ncbi:MAG: single-stranded-DNA-specific exonuclease RecJ [Bacillota bacterium]|nr:single-stranded-DNA-specific exonuclease RecJ [Bacillota bacterium]
MEAKWMLRNTKADMEGICRTIGVSPVAAKILANRGIKDIDTAKRFLNASLKDLYNPYEMKDLYKAVDIILDKIGSEMKILVVGDFDADGVFSTFCLYSALKECGADVDYYIPHRISEGYGISSNIVEKAAEDGYDTIITCDNGIAAAEQIKLAKNLGLTVIITDHHDIPFTVDEAGEVVTVMPEADAIVNPKQEDCSYPFKSLCGAGIVFKFIQVLFDEIGMEPEEALKYLEFVSIATVCDVVDLIDENRIIVKNGLKMINRTKNIGLKALISASALEGKEILTYHLGFVIGPCINATGRLETASLSLELLMCKDMAEAKSLAEKLVQLNNERKDMTTKSVEGVIEKIEANNMMEDKVLVVFDERIHESIAGIVAGRIKEKYNTPTIILTEGSEMAKGSARSIEGYNMFEELSKCKHLLGKFGGHPMAAGLSLPHENIKTLKKLLNDNSTLTLEDKAPKLFIDMQLPFEKISLNIVDELKKLEPFGKGNTRPIFAEKNIQVQKVNILGQNKNMLKLRIKSLNGTVLDAIQFDGVAGFEKFVIDNWGASEYEKLLQGILISKIQIDLMFTPSINEYGGNRTLQLQIVDYRRSR